jgi:hypothetical protein
MFAPEALQVEGSRAQPLNLHETQQQANFNPGFYDMAE